MGNLTGILAAEPSPFTTGDPLGDLTSYGVFGIIALTAWRLFRWWRDDLKSVDQDHAAVTARLRKDRTVLLAHITLLTAEIARHGGEIPELPRLDD